MPFGDFSHLLLLPDAEEKENDYVMLSDIFPTGYHATELDIHTNVRESSALAGHISRET